MKIPKNLIALLFIIGTTFTTNAQLQVGHTTITFNDPARTGGFGSGGGPGRQIQTEIYYPADVAGTDVAVSSGTYPVVVFGHGFAMSWDAYENIWEELVPEGYVLAFPRTEGGLFPPPDHEDFGLDLALVVDKMQDENTNTSSLLNGHLSAKTAIVGHSMGGGATIIAAASNTSIATIVGMAPAETNPSAIAAAVNVSVPALIFSADQDLVTPAIDHHTPIYNDLGSSCKYFINIIGGAHCYYANPNFNCDLGESTSGGSITITRETQQDILYTYLIPWLDIYLYDDCDQHAVFETDLGNDSDVTFLASCSGFPNPSYDLNVSTNQETLTSNDNGGPYQWIDCDNANNILQGETNQSYTATQTGNYAVILGTGSCADTSACYPVTVSSTASIDELSHSEKKLIGIYTITGQKTVFKPNTALIYFYEDGSRERVFVIED
jgi:dienelactone hydrolase